MSSLKPLVWPQKNAPMFFDCKADDLSGSPPASEALYKDEENEITIEAEENRNGNLMKESADGGKVRTRLCRHALFSNIPFLFLHVSMKTC